MTGRWTKRMTWAAASTADSMMAPVCPRGLNVPSGAQPVLMSTTGSCSWKLAEADVFEVDHAFRIMRLNGDHCVR